jgi:DNA helicase-2/ATP-dependent DNA helicase PcrA
MGASSVDKLLAQAVSTSTSIWKVMQDPAFVATLPTAAQRGIENLKSLQLRFSRLFQASPTEPIDFSIPPPFDVEPQLTDPSSPTLASPNETLLNASQTDNPNAGPTESDDEGTSDMATGLMRLIDALKYREEIQRLYDDPEESAMRIGSLESVFNAIAQYEFSTTEPSLDGFLTSVTLTGREFGSSKDKNQGLNAVSLMTYHSAKGLEFPIVYMIGMEEGVLPHRRSISEELDSVDEERRLCYVGVTRAQDELTLTLPQSRFKWGKPRPTYPSRFLYELTDQADNPNRAKAIQAALEDVRRERKKR